MDKSKTEEQLLAGIRKSTDSQIYLNLMALLESRLTRHDKDLRTATEAEYKIVQGKAQEIDHLLKALSRKGLTKQFTGAFN